MSKSVLKNTLILSIGILLGRLSGYIRELIIASEHGVTKQADSIILMLAIPDLLNNLVASGAIIGILIPMLTINEGKTEKVISEFTRKLFFISIVFYISTTAVIFFIYDFYLSGLFAISLLSIFPNIYTFIISGCLQYKQRFKKQALSTLVFNIVITLFLLAGSQNYIFALGVILASVVRTLWVYSDLKHTKISIVLFPEKNPTSSLSYKTLVFMILANGLMFINPMIDKVFASFLGGGSVAVLSYAEKIYLLPVAVFLTTYAVAMFPDLAKMVANNNKLEANRVLKKALSLNIVISILAGLTLYMFSYEIVDIFFKIARLDLVTINQISLVLNGYIVALIIAGTNSILVKLIFAHKWYESLIIYSVFIVSAKIVLNLLVLKFSLSIEYIAYGTSLVGVLSIVYLSLLYVKKKV